MYPVTNIKESLLILALSTSLLLISSLVGFVYKKMHFKLGPTEQSLQSLAVFSSVGIVTLGLNAIELISSLHIFGKFATADTNSSEVPLLAVTKGTYVAIYLIIALVFAVIGWKKAKTFPIFSCSCCFCCIRSGVRRNLIHSLIFVSVSTFTLSLVISICPTLLLIFVYPIETISLLLFVGTSLF